MAPSNGTSVSLAHSRRAWVGAGMVSTCSTRTAIDLAAGASSTSKMVSRMGWNGDLHTKIQHDAADLRLSVFPCAELVSMSAQKVLELPIVRRIQLLQRCHKLAVIHLALLDSGLLLLLLNTKPTSPKNVV